MEPLQVNEKTVPELPHGWVWTTLGDILQCFESGSRPKGGVRNIESGIPSIGGEHLTANGKFDFTKIKYVPTGFFAQMSKGIIQRRDVLIVKDGATTGKTSIVREDFPFENAAVNEHVFLARPYQEINNRYLFYYLFSPFGKNYVAKNFKGTAQGGINLSFAKNTFVPIPPLSEQRRIVTKIEELFTQLDAGVGALTNTKAQLKRYHQSVLKSACEGRLVPTEAEMARAEGRDYEPADVLLACIRKERREKWDAEKKRKDKKSTKYKEPAAPDVSGLPELPEGWVWARLDSLAELKGGITKDSKRVLTNARKIPYLRVANVQRGYLDLNEIKKIEAPESVISKLLLKPGDILFTEGGDRDKLGRGCVWNGEIPECIHQNHIFRGRLYSNGASNKIISWFGNTFGQIYFMREGKQTTNLASINLTKLSAFPVPLPPLSEQHRIVAEIERRLSVTDEIEKTVDQSLKQAEHLRQSILKRAFEGKLVPQDSNDEPASVLLKRIKEEKIRCDAEEKAKKKSKAKPKRKKMKVRKDAETEKQTVELYEILRLSKVPPTLKELWQSSKLEIEDFYDQLKIEVEKGRIIERRRSNSDVVLEIVI